MLRHTSAVLVLAAAAAGCSLAPEPDVEDDHFEHRALTAWAPIPSSDGSQLAFVLEPRRVDADSHGAIVDGWRGRVAGDALVRRAIGPDAKTVFAVVPGGFHHTDYDAQSAYVFTTQGAEWSPTMPNDLPPPPSGFVSMTVLARDSLAVTGSRSFDPPLERPFAVGGGTILDTPREGTSDVLRAIRLVAHGAASGSTHALHEAQGFSAFSCARTGSVTVAYRPQGASTMTTIVDVAFDPVTHEGHVAVLDVDDYRPTAVICRGGGAHAVILGDRASRAAKRAVVVKRSGEQLAIAQDVEAGEPAALSTDGATLLAARSDGQAALFTASGTVDLPGVRGYDVQSSAERALLIDNQGGWVVRLDGTAPATARVPHDVATNASRRAFATGGGGFVFFDSTYSYGTNKDAVVQSFVMDSEGQAHDVVIDRAYTRPSVAHADGKRAYLIVAGEDEDIDVLTLDLASYAVAPVTKAAFCDLPTVRAMNRCLP